MDIFDHHSSLCGGVVRACLPGRVLRRLDGGGDEVVDGVAEEPQGDAHRRLFGNNGGNSSYGDWWKSLDCPYQHHSQPADSQGLVHFTAEVLPSVQAGGYLCRNVATQHQRPDRTWGDEMPIAPKFVLHSRISRQRSNQFRAIRI